MKEIFPGTIYQIETNDELKDLLEFLKSIKTTGAGSLTTDVKKIEKLIYNENGKDPNDKNKNYILNFRYQNKKNEKDVFKHLCRVHSTFNYLDPGCNLHMIALENNENVFGEPCHYGKVLISFGITLTNLFNVLKSMHQLDSVDDIDLCKNCFKKSLGKICLCNCDMCKSTRNCRGCFDRKDYLNI